MPFMVQSPQPHPSISSPLFVFPLPSSPRISSPLLSSPLLSRFVLKKKAMLPIPWMAPESLARKCVQY